MARRAFCPGIAPTFSISNASFRRSIRASRCRTGASTSPRRIIFTRDFFGVSDALGTVQFSATNPLQFWRTDGVQGINRRPFFNTAAAPPGLRTEAQTLALGTQYSAFRTMEGNPHGSAHTSFGGFDLQHPDRRERSAVLPASLQCRPAVGEVAAPERPLQSGAGGLVTTAIAGNPIGHNLPDTMWPWNGITGGPRPPTAPGGAMAASPCVSAPGPQPRVRDCLDYHGLVNAVSRMGFDYDDVRVLTCLCTRR